MKVQFILPRSGPKVWLAAATDDSRPVLNHVHASYETSKIVRLEAADGFLFVRAWVKATTAVPKNFSALIPRQLFSESRAVLLDRKYVVPITIEQPSKSKKNEIGWAMASRGKHLEIKAHLSSGTFPDVDKLIESAINPDISKLIAAGRSSDRKHIGSKVDPRTTRVPENFKALNASLIKRLLNALGSTHIVRSYFPGDRHTPAIFSSVDDADDFSLVGTAIGVLMPMFTSWDNDRVHDATKK